MKYDGIAGVRRMRVQLYPDDIEDRDVTPKAGGILGGFNPNKRKCGRAQPVEQARLAEMAKAVARQGRGQDTEVAHVALGEIVVPWALQNAEVMAVLRRAAAECNIPFESLRVGHRRNSINPATGAAEFDPSMLDEIQRRRLAPAEPAPAPGYGFGALAEPPRPLPSVAAGLKKAEAMYGLPDDQAAQLLGVHSNALSQKLYGVPRDKLTETQRAGQIELLNRRASNAVDLTRPEVEAFLDDIITPIEGGATNRRYGGGTFAGQGHPGKVYDKSGNILYDKDGNTLSAAGDFQMIKRTWDGVSDFLGMQDFSNPINQRLGAMQRLKDRGALEPLLKGDVQGAMWNLRDEWSALPDGKQPRISKEEAQRRFDEGVARRRY